MRVVYGIRLAFQAERYRFESCHPLQIFQGKHNWYCTGLLLRLSKDLAGSTPALGAIFIVINTIERTVINSMVESGILPLRNIFPITELILENYILIYGTLFGKNDKGLVRNNEFRFARRLAGLTLLKINFERGAKFNSIEAGIVYMISNASYPDHYKIGMTIELNNRLEIYQTYDPYRNFKIKKYDFVLNRTHIESRILAHPDVVKEGGEWIKKNNAIEVFENICFYSGTKDYSSVAQ
jgi:hypothetical protein